MNVSANTFIRLREVYVINNLKKQISQLKKVISSKDGEIESYKNNVRCAKYSKLEFNYSNNLNQLIQIKKENENLRNNYEEISSKCSEEVEGNQKLISSLTKYRSQYDEIKIKNKIWEDSNYELNAKAKYLEEKVALLNKSIMHQPIQLSRVSVREKNNTINRQKDEIQELKDKFKAERQRLEKRIFYMADDFRKVKDALE
jgi:predicted nuclease with TOPRIM domain